MEGDFEKDFHIPTVMLDEYLDNATEGSVAEEINECMNIVKSYTTDLMSELHKHLELMLLTGIGVSITMTDDKGNEYVNAFIGCTADNAEKYVHNLEVKDE